MATVTDEVGINDGATMNISAVISYDDVTGIISRVTWSNNGSRAAICTIMPPNRDTGQPLSFTMAAGRQNVRTNVPAGPGYNYLDQNFGMSLNPA